MRSLLYCRQLRLTLTRSVSEVAQPLPRLRFGLVWIRTISTAGSIRRWSAILIVAAIATVVLPAPRVWAAGPESAA